MGTRLYVGNLSYETSEEVLRKIFEDVGSVTRCELMADKYTGKSRGFAFVEMGSQEDADKAVEENNGKDCEGRRLIVNEARPREERGGSSGPRGGGGGGGGYGGGGGGGGARAKRKPGKGSRRGVRKAKREAKGFW